MASKKDGFLPKDWASCIGRNKSWHQYAKDGLVVSS